MSQIININILYAFELTAYLPEDSITIKKIRNEKIKENSSIKQWIIKRIFKSGTLKIPRYLPCVTELQKEKTMQLLEGHY